jgi:hypothetical protein
MVFFAHSQAPLKDIPVRSTIYWAKTKNWFDVTTCYFDDSLSVSFKIGKVQEDLQPPPRQQKSLNDMYRQITEVTSDCLWEWDFLASIHEFSCLFSRKSNN